MYKTGHEVMRRVSCPSCKEGIGISWIAIGRHKERKGANNTCKHCGAHLYLSKKSATQADIIKFLSLFLFIIFGALIKLFSSKDVVLIIVKIVMAIFLGWIIFLSIYSFSMRKFGPPEILEIK